MKFISYDPAKIPNVPAFMNKYIYETDDEYLMFIFNDILEQIENKEVMIAKYVELMKIFKLPFSFYPYYIHFNKVLTDSISKPNPRAHINLQQGYKFDVIDNMAYGMLILNINMLKSINFKFNEKYKCAFYLNDLVHACYVNKMILSEVFFLDIFESYKYMKSNMKTGFMIDPKIFNDEKNLFINDVKLQPEPINNFIQNIKKLISPETSENKQNQQNQGA